MSNSDEGDTLVSIHTCWSDGEADVIVAFLATNEVEAFRNTQLDHALFPITADGLAEIHILVPERSAGRARALLAEQVSGDIREGQAP